MSIVIGLRDARTVLDRFQIKTSKVDVDPEALSLFMINHPYLDSLNDIEIYNALKNYSRL